MSTPVVKMGRPSLLDEDRAKKIVEMVRDGNSRITAAKSVGVGLSTLKNWLARGKSDAPEDAPYREFREQVTKAENDFKREVFGLIVDAAKGKSLAAMTWILERRWPEEFGKVDRLKAEHKHIHAHALVSTSARDALLSDENVMALACDLDRAISRPQLSNEVRRLPSPDFGDFEDVSPIESSGSNL